MLSQASPMPSLSLSDWFGFLVVSQLSVVSGTPSPSVSTSGTVGVLSHASPMPSLSVSVWLGFGTVDAVVLGVRDAVAVGVGAARGGVAGVADAVAVGVGLARRWASSAQLSLAVRDAVAVGVARTGSFFVARSSTLS